MTDKIEFPDNATNMQVLGPAMEITEQAEADAHFETIVDYAMRRDATLSREAVEKTTRDSLGYWAGYYSLETRQRVERLFRCVHPVFGPAEHGPVAAAEALEAGIRVAEAHAKGLPFDEAIARGREAIKTSEHLK
jgi:hypothetical protein